MTENLANPTERADTRRSTRWRFRKLNSIDRPVVSADLAFEALDIDRSTGYKAIKDGTFPLPIIRVGRVIRIPTSALLQLLQQSESTAEVPEDR